MSQIMPTTDGGKPQQQAPQFVQRTGGGAAGGKQQSPEELSPATQLLNDTLTDADQKCQGKNEFSQPNNPSSGATSAFVSHLSNQKTESQQKSQLKFENSFNPFAKLPGAELIDEEEECLRNDEEVSKMDHTSAFVVIENHQQTAKQSMLMAQANGTGGFVDQTNEETTTLTIEDQTQNNPLNVKQERHWKETGGWAKFDVTLSGQNGQKEILGQDAQVQIRQEKEDDARSEESFYENEQQQNIPNLIGDTRELFNNEPEVSNNLPVFGQQKEQKLSQFYKANKNQVSGPPSAVTHFDSDALGGSYKGVTPQLLLGNRPPMIQNSQVQANRTLDKSQLQNMTNGVNQSNTNPNQNLTGINARTSYQQTRLQMPQSTLQQQSSDHNLSINSHTNMSKAEGQGAFEQEGSNHTKGSEIRRIRTQVQNDQSSGGNMSYLERMANQHSQNQYSSNHQFFQQSAQQQRVLDPMQATFASLRGPQTAASAQAINRMSEFNNGGHGGGEITPSEQSHINPFSIASRQSEIPHDQQVTAEGFFKNPIGIDQAQARKQAAGEPQKESSLRINKQNNSQPSVSDQPITRKNQQSFLLSTPNQGHSNVPLLPKSRIQTNSKQQTRVSTGAQSNSTGVFRIKRSQIEAAPKNINTNEMSLNNSGVNNTSKAEKIPGTNFDKPPWLDNAADAPFDQTLKPVRDIDEMLAISRYQSQGNPPSHQQQWQPMQIGSNVPNVHKQLSHPTSTQIQEQYANHQGYNYQPTIGSGLMQTPHSGPAPAAVEEKKAQLLINDIREVFSPIKPKRHNSEQKRPPQSQPANGVDSPKIHNQGDRTQGGFGVGNFGSYLGAIPATHMNYNSVSKPFEAAARLGLMGSQDMPSLQGILSPTQGTNQHFSDQKINAFSHSVDYFIDDIGPNSNNQNSVFGGGRGLISQQPIQPRYGQPTALHQVPVGQMQQQRLMAQQRKVASQGLMMPHQQNAIQATTFNNVGLGFQAVDHFPINPHQLPLNNPNKNIADSARSDTREKPVGSSMNTQKRLSIGSRPNVGNNVPTIRPIASKNMPQCFRENPNYRKKPNTNASEFNEHSNYETPTPAQVFSAANASVAVLNVGQQSQGQSPFGNGPSAATGGPRQASGQKQRSFSNDAKIILQGNPKMQQPVHKQVHQHNSIIGSDFPGNNNQTRRVGASYAGPPSQYLGDLNGSQGNF